LILAGGRIAIGFANITTAPAFFPLFKAVTAFLPPAAAIALFWLAVGVLRGGVTRRGTGLRGLAGIAGFAGFGGGIAICTLTFLLWSALSGVATAVALAIAVSVAVAVAEALITATARGAALA
jgi:hypothetical protein